jgi:hypothetical protein
MKNQKKLVVVGIAALFLLSLPLAAAEKKGEVTIDQYLAHMMRDGWIQVTDGVLQKSLGNGKTQTLTFGVGGLQWRVQEAENRYGDFVRLYKAHPTPDGARAIEAQTEQVKSLRQTLANLRPEEAISNFEAFLNTGCNISYGANADAYPLTSSQGVGANANAYFWNDCGHSGSVYAYAYVAGQLGNSYTTSYQRDPFSGTYNGTSVSSNASRTLSATSQCYSYAEAAVTSASLGISLTATDSNYSCPPPPPNVYISGSTYVYLTGYNCTTVTWNAVGSGGTPGYSYAWYFNGSYAGSGSSHSEYFCGYNSYSYTNYPLSVTLTDSASQTDSDSTTVTVETAEDYQDPCNYRNRSDGTKMAMLPIYCY